MPKRVSAILLLALASACSPVLYADTGQAIASCEQLKETGEALWQSVDTQLAANSPSVHNSRRGHSGWRFEASANGTSVVWTLIGSEPRTLTSLQIETQRNERPLSQWVLGPQCNIQSHRTINYDDDGLAVNLVIKNGNRDAVEHRLNPPVPDLDSTMEASPVVVALVDSGVNYTLPSINVRLARDTEGNLLSKDYWDNDGLPFDAHPVGSAFNVLRHGTRTASILLRESPDAALIAYRYPRPDMSLMTQLLAHAAEHGVSVMGLPLGGNKEDQWQAFFEAAKRYPNILFIASAGNNGRDIDKFPVYPASLPLENLLVVTSADDFVQPAERVNWGRVSVDYMLPAEQISVTDFDGATTVASGSSYAVPRAVAMAARMKQSNPTWHASDIIAEFARRYDSGASVRYVNAGYIADPLADNSIVSGIASTNSISIQANENESKESYQLPLKVWALGDSWSDDEIAIAIKRAAKLLTQCSIGIADVTLQRVTAADYLMDLSVSNAHTLFGKLRPRGQQHPAAVVFARDTKMLQAFDGEAFGRGNTRRREWMRDSVWLTHGIIDAGFGLAHELYHVLANNGEHNTIEGNLMQAFTKADATKLSEKQCEQAISNAQAQKLIELRG